MNNHSGSHIMQLQYSMLQIALAAVTLATVTLAAVTLVAVKCMYDDQQLAPVLRAHHASLCEMHCEMHRYRGLFDSELLADSLKCWQCLLHSSSQLKHALVYAAMQQR